MRKIGEHKQSAGSTFQKAVPQNNIAYIYKLYQPQNVPNIYEKTN